VATALQLRRGGLGVAVWLLVVGVALGGALYSRGKAVGRIKRGGGGLVPSGERRGAP
jgi:hypothetical protein